MLSAQPFVIDAPNHSRIRGPAKRNALRSQAGADEDGGDASREQRELAITTGRAARACYPERHGPLERQVSSPVRRNEALRSSTFSLWAGLLGLLARPRTPQRFKRECEKAFTQSI
jgi:hypothetical protein